MNAPQDFRLMAADTVGKDLLSALVTEIKLLPAPWAKMSKKKQDDVIDRLRSRVTSNVSMAVHLIASEGRTVVAGALDQITIKDGVKAVVKFGTGAANLQELYEVAGKSVLVVVANPADHSGGMDEIKGEEDQRAMDLGHEYHENDGGGMDQYKNDDVVDAEVISITHQPLQSELDEQYNAGQQAAADGKPENDCPIMKGALCIAWVRGWKQWHEDQGGDAAYLLTNELFEQAFEENEAFDMGVADAEKGITENDAQGIADEVTDDEEGSIKAAYMMGWKSWHARKDQRIDDIEPTTETPTAETDKSKDKSWPFPKNNKSRKTE